VNDVEIFPEGFKVFKKDIDGKRTAKEGDGHSCGICQEHDHSCGHVFRCAGQDEYRAEYRADAGCPAETERCADKNRTEITDRFFFDLHLFILHEDIDFQKARDVKPKKDNEKAADFF